MIISQAQKIFL